MDELETNNEDHEQPEENSKATKIGERQSKENKRITVTTNRHFEKKNTAEDKSVSCSYLYSQN